MTTIHKLNIIRYYQDILNPSERRDYNYGFQSFQNCNEIIYQLDNKKVLSGFMLRDNDDQIHIEYGVGDRSMLNFILVTFEDKINYQTKFGVNFYSLRVIENNINRVPKSHIYEAISWNVIILPCMKENIANQLQFTVVGDDYTVLKTDATVGLPEYCIDLYN